MNTEAGNNFRHSGSVNVCPLVLWFFRLTAFNSVEQFSLSADWSSPGRHGNVSWTEPRAWRTASCQIIVFKFNNQTSHHRWGFYISVKDWCSVTWLNNTWKILVNRRAIHLFQIYYIIRFYSDESWIIFVSDLLILLCCLIVWRFDGCYTCFSVLIRCLEMWTAPPAGPGLYEFMDLCDMYETVIIMQSKYH